MIEQQVIEQRMIGKRSNRWCWMLAAVAFVAAGLATAGAGIAHAGSMADASVVYANGNDSAAARRLARLAMSGNARAQGLLGFMYEYGRGVPQDFTVAAEWYSRAAEQGDATAQYLLGLLYDKGRGVPADAVLAHKWLILAATRCGRRERDAYIKLRDAVATKMSEGQIALAQRLATEWVPVRER